MTRTLDNATYDAIINALEATQAYAKPRLSQPRQYLPDAKLMELDMRVTDALELIDRQDAAA